MGNNLSKTARITSEQSNSRLKSLIQIIKNADITTPEKMESLREMLHLLSGECFTFDDIIDIRSRSYNELGVTEELKVSGDIERAVKSFLNEISDITGGR